jgi:hypothetical protein
MHNKTNTVPLLKGAPPGASKKVSSREPLPMLRQSIGGSIEQQTADETVEPVFPLSLDAVSTQTCWPYYRGSRAIRRANLEVRLSFLANYVQTMFYNVWLNCGKIQRSL